VTTVYVFSLKEDGNTTVFRNFKVKEFACKDGSDPVFISYKLGYLLQKIRGHFNAPVIINSAYRTASHNKEVGGAAFSQHLYGAAADIVVKGVDPAAVADYAEKVLGNSGGVGRYDTFTHVDTRPTKSRWKG